MVWYTDRTDFLSVESVLFPLTLGVVGALLAPQLAAIGAIAALVTQCTIVVEKETQETGEEEA